MRISQAHLSDQELLLAIDRELAGSRSAQALAHLDACSQCHDRLQKIEAFLENIDHLHESIEPQMPDAVVARARLEIRLRELAVKSGKTNSVSAEHAVPAPRGLTYAFAALFIAVVALTVMHERNRTSTEGPTTAAAPAPVPERKLTPGVTRPVNNQEICRLPSGGNNADVPPQMRRAVFQEYGIANARPEDYEVDYLISPALGGTANIGNLWPEPYSTIWNAHVKDALENRLHQLVCDGRVPLATAQRDISTDWISAYKKYFGSDLPITNGSGLDAPRPNPSSGAAKSS